MNQAASLINETLGMSQKEMVSASDEYKGVETPSDICSGLLYEKDLVVSSFIFGTEVPGLMD